MSTIQEILANTKSVFVFDIDGVLAVYAYGERNHNVCREDAWQDYVQNHDLYATAQPVKILQGLIRQHDSSRVFVCTRASRTEMEQKRDFAVKQYGINPEHVLFTHSNRKKLGAMRFLHDRFFQDLPDELMVMIEDSADVLTNIQDHSDYSTVHISYFLNAEHSELERFVSGMPVNREGDDADGQLPTT